MATPLFEDIITGIIVSKTHRLARRQHVRLGEMAHERLIMADRVINPEVYDLILRAFHMVGFTSTAFTTDDTMATNTAPTTTLVAAGHGWTLIPSSVRRAMPPAVRYIPLSDFAVPVTLQVMRRIDDRSIRTRTFVRISRQIGALISRRSEMVRDRPAATEQVAG